jgi:hypothetical protein
MPKPPLQQRLIIGLLAVLFASHGVTPARADDPAVEMWLQQRVTFDNFIRNMKPLDKHRIGDVLELQVDKKNLVLRTPLNNITSEQSMRATFDGMHGLGIVAVRRDDRSDVPVEPTTFSLTVMDFPAPRQTTTIQVSQSTQPNQLTLAKTVQTTNGPSVQIMFTQQKAGISAGAGLVQLTVTESHSQGQAPEQLSLEGIDFLSFVKDHPVETDQYVRPLLRELGQEAVFAPDQLLAWQVFSDLWQPDATVTRRVQELLPQLNASNYHQRDAALGQLRELGRNGAAALIHLNRAQLTPEQNARVDLALVPYAQLSMSEAARRRSDPGFLLDCLYSEDVSLRKVAIDRLRQIIRPDIQFDVNADAETRIAAIQSLRPQLLPSSAPSK